MKRLAALSLLAVSVLSAACGTSAPRAASLSLYSYRWPVKPFDRQHPVRGGFGDPRTMAVDQPFGVTGPAASGSYQFHNGIDIVAKPGTPVYPVVSGRVVFAGEHEVVVASSAHRRFQYWHLRWKVERGQHVVAETTVLGWIQRPFDHVHLTEIDGRVVQNPLAPGHLAPYSDTTTPRALALDFDNGESPYLTRGGRLGRHDALAVEAIDPPAMRVPGPFAGLPQAPAFVEWRIQSGETWSGWHVAADFRRTVPSRSFWSVYAPGTYQNFPVFAHRLYWKTAGLYLFRIHLNKHKLARGPHQLETRVADVRGNASTAVWTIQIGKRQ